LVRRQSLDPPGVALEVLEVSLGGSEQHIVEAMNGLHVRQL
jgi:hypothetical protein